jgi:hypothetical protein
VYDKIKKQDPAVYKAIRAEVARQQDGIELIASENFTSEAVMEAQGSVMTNKYAEGYPGKRYYGGCENMDVVESLAIERAKKLFGADGYYYFVHSYYPVPAERDWEGARTPYGTDFCSAIVRGAAVATQFHPEKSGTAGLLCLKKLIQSWARR